MPVLAGGLLLVVIVVVVVASCLSLRMTHLFCVQGSAKAQGHTAQILYYGSRFRGLRQLGIKTRESACFI